MEGARTRLTRASRLSSPRFRTRFRTLPHNAFETLRHTTQAGPLLAAFDVWRRAWCASAFHLMPLLRHTIMPSWIGGSWLRWGRKGNGHRWMGRAWMASWKCSGIIEGLVVRLHPSALKGSWQPERSHNERKTRCDRNEVNNSAFGQSRHLANWERWQTQLWPQRVSIGSENFTKPNLWRKKEKERFRVKTIWWVLLT